MRLILASASPRRAELLRAAGYAFDVLTADVDERMRPGESAEHYVRRLARQKCDAVARRRSLIPCVVLAADTTVVANGEVLGKPTDRSDAARMLAVLSGAMHEVVTGLCVRLVSDTVPEEVSEEVSDEVSEDEVSVETTRVWFSRLSPAEIDRYLATGEWTDKAGGYGIQGYASRFIPRIEGSYANVVGLPVARVHTLLNSLKIPNFW